MGGRLLTAHFPTAAPEMTNGPTPASGSGRRGELVVSIHQGTGTEVGTGARAETPVASAAWAPAPAAARAGRLYKKEPAHDAQSVEI